MRFSGMAKWPRGIRIERIAELLIPDSERSKTLVGLLELLEFYAVFFQ